MVGFTVKMIGTLPTIELTRGIELAVLGLPLFVIENNRLGGRVVDAQGLRGLHKNKDYLDYRAPL